MAGSIKRPTSKRQEAIRRVSGGLREMRLCVFIMLLWVLIFGGFFCLPFILVLERESFWTLLGIVSILTVVLFSILGLILAAENVPLSFLSTTRFWRRLPRRGNSP